MEQMPFGCMSGMMGNGDVTLSPPLKRLYDEHGPLREQMKQCRASAQAVLEEGDRSGWEQRLDDLTERVNAFLAELDPHSLREEDGLFPMVAAYIGRETGPIAVMEYEHHTAKSHLDQFLRLTEKEKQPTPEAATTGARHVLAAIDMLEQHFAKEEHVLFPLAERLLSEAEKQQLAERFGDT